MGKERDFSARVREAVKGAGKACYPVETGGTVAGFPDLVVVQEGGASFVELKCRPKLPVSRAADSDLEGPGQRAFARRLAQSSRHEALSCVVSARPLLLAECMDGVALLAEERGGRFIAACWESFPGGDDLLRAIRAWRTSVSPSRKLVGSSIGSCYEACARVYLACTGIAIGLDGIEGYGDPLGEEDAPALARDISDRGRIALQEERMDRTLGCKEE